MKYFILVCVTFLFCVTSQAAQNWFPVGKENANTVWTSKARCEAQEGQECYEVTGKDLRRWKVGQVDDLTKPNFRPVKDSPVLQSCENFIDCQRKAKDPNADKDQSDRLCLSDGSAEKWDELANWPDLTGIDGPWFIWCEKHDGTYQQKAALVPDLDGIAAADAEDAQKAADKVARAQARTGRATAAQGCVDAVNGGGNLAQTQIKDCIEILVKEVYESQLSTDDL